MEDDNEFFKKVCETDIFKKIRTFTPITDSKFAVEFLHQIEINPEHKVF